MRLFGLNLGGADEDPDIRARREASQRSLEQGGLPLNAIDRLQEQKARQGTPQHFFTSDLSVNEFVLNRRLGFEPLGQVMGSSIYHVGWQQNIGQTTGWTWKALSLELTVLTEAYYQARHRALGRLQQEAALLGATGIVGVRLERTAFEWGAGLLEFAAIGTAIREIGAPAPDHPQPFLSALSGSEHYALRQSGYRPVGFALGNCAYYCVPGIRTQNALTGGILGGGWRNQELHDFTQAVYNARSLAMGRMEEEARHVRADGIVGVDVDVVVEPVEVEVNDSKRTDMLYFFTATGTAVTLDNARATTTPEMTVSLR